ncbi:MAG TPA: acyl carrier protein [Thermotogota bacterium]|nr:acyl carrier protein [Thermotogota bacterium]HRW91575.1 acyl carrier protein [Thermotogota bacterium]
MGHNELFEKVRTVIVENLGVEPEVVTPTASLIDDIGADSLELVDLTMDVEEQLGVRIDNAELSDVETVGDILELIEKKLRVSA